MPPKPLCQLIGAGRAGCAIAGALYRSGYRFTWICSRQSADAEKLANAVDCRNYGIDFNNFHGHAGFFIISVSDSQISRVASEASAAGIFESDSVVAHLSGALGSDVLDPARQAGASVMAFHPAQSFTHESDPERVFRGICFDMEGDDRACALGENIAHDLGAEPVRLTADQRIISHLSMTAASNYTVTLVRMAEDIMKSAGISSETAHKMLMPLFSQTTDNIINSGTLKALTGPAARGDSEIIRKHLTALNTINAEYSSLYKLMAQIAVRMSVERGDISRSKAEEILREL